jgi:hypothetical protein
MATTPGPLKLPPPSAGATGEAAVADVNGDHRDDVVATDAKGVSVYLGQADGTFSAPIHTDVAIGTPLFVTLGDFNNDHKVDGALWDGQTVMPLLGNGDGTFTSGTPPVQDIPAIGRLDNQAQFTRPIAVDFNNDGALDLASLNYTQSLSGMVLILPGNGDGTFNSANARAGSGHPPTWPAGVNPQLVGLVAGDFDGDGLLDDLSAEQGANASILSLNNGKGGFVTTMIYAGTLTTTDVGAADFNGDGILDLLVTGSYDTRGTTAARVYLGPIAAITSTGYVTRGGSPGVGVRAALGDLNGDGAPDVALTDNGSVNIAIGRGDGTFGMTTQYWADASGVGYNFWIDLGDFNGDGKRDVLVSGKQGLEVLINSGCMGSGINGVTGGSFGGSMGGSSGSSSSAGMSGGSAGMSGGPSCNIGTPFQPPGAAMCPSNNQCSAPPYSCVTTLAVQQGLKCCCDPAGHMCIGCQATEQCGGAYNNQPVSCCP